MDRFGLRGMSGQFLWSCIQTYGNKEIEQIQQERREKELERELERRQREEYWEKEGRSDHHRRKEVQSVPKNDKLEDMKVELQKMKAELDEASNKLSPVARETDSSTKVQKPVTNQKSESSKELLGKMLKAQDQNRRVMQRELTLHRK